MDTSFHSHANGQCIHSAQTKIVDTSFSSNTYGHRTHTAWTYHLNKLWMKQKSNRNKIYPFEQKSAHFKIFRTQKFRYYGSLFGPRTWRYGREKHLPTLYRSHIKSFQIKENFLNTSICQPNYSILRLGSSKYLSFGILKMYHRGALANF